MSRTPEWNGEGDVDRLRASLDFGSTWTKDEARSSLGWHERRFRLAIAALREMGYPVIATSEQGSVYRKARSRDEVEEFIAREIQSRVSKLLEQERAMRGHLSDYFAPEQLRVAI